MNRSTGLWTNAQPQRPWPDSGPADPCGPGERCRCAPPVQDPLDPYTQRVVAFLVLGGIGIALLLVSLLVGEFLDGVFDGVGGDWLSGAAVAGFLGAFGFAGALAFGATQSTALAIVVGIVAGVLIGVGVGVLTSKLREDDGSTVRTSALVGSSGTVISEVPAGTGYGEVSVVASGHITKLNARSTEALPAGTAITIAAVLSPTSVAVERRA